MSLIVFLSFLLQTLMNVKLEWTIVMTILPVWTHWEVSCVHATLDTLEMALFVMVSTKGVVLYGLWYMNIILLHWPVYL